MQLIQVLVVNKSKFPLPKYQTINASGFDLQANLEEPAALKPGQRLAIPTGLFVQFPDGYEIQIRPRSGMALNHGITVLNTPGTVDADYRGEIKVILANLTREEFTVNPGDRIAQGVLCPVVQASFREVQELDSTARGEGGFGSTGKN
jgi:dUTP pyrophosphatase